MQQYTVFRILQHLIAIKYAFFITTVLFSGQETSEHHMANKKAKIYVAGASGLVGRAIVTALQREGYSNIVTRTHEQLDLTNQIQVDEFFAKEKPEYVFLAAAKVGGILANQEYPADFIYQNLAIELNVIRACYEYQVKKLLFLGSSCIYPRDCLQPIKEEYLLTGPLEKTNEAYAVAKIAGIIMCQSYNRQYGTNFISCMPTNLYGRYDNFDPNTSHVLPALLRKIHTAKIMGAANVTLWGNGTPRRELLHVSDCADACIFLMKYYDCDEIVNVGTGREVTIMRLAEIISSIVGYQGTITWDTSKPNGTPRKLLNMDKLKGMGWEPKISLAQGIQDTYAWCLRYNIF